MTDFEAAQQERRLRGQGWTAAVLDELQARNPHLVEYAEWILAAPVDDPPLTDPIKTAAMLRDQIGALRMLRARREMGQIAHFLQDQPDHELAPQYRGRFLELTRFVRGLDRSGKVRSRPWEQILAREENLPPRAAWPAKTPGPKE